MINAPASFHINPKWENKKTNKEPLFSSCTHHLFLFAPDSGVFFRLLGWNQAGVLDERTDPLAVFPQAVPVLEGHQHQPVLPNNHPASGAWTNTSTVCPRPTFLILTSFLLVLSVFSQLYIQQITDVDGTLDCFRFGVSSSVNGLVIGATVMEGFYVVFDRAQRRVGFALSSCAGEDTGYISNPEPSL